LKGTTVFLAQAKLFPFGFSSDPLVGGARLVGNGSSLMLYITDKIFPCRIFLILIIILKI
jgi:hypothetical protein